MKKFMLITDAWPPQTNGVITTWSTVLSQFETMDFEIQVVHPGRFKTFPLPSYPEIRLARDPWKMRSMISSWRPDYVHIATEGTLGVFARWWLPRRQIPFTTSLHTKFPEYVTHRTGLPVSVGYRFIRWFHRAAERSMTTTATHKAELESWGLADLVAWGRGVDSVRFTPQPLEPRARPRLLYVGRVAVEKNMEAFLNLDIDADKIIVGDGPQRATLEKRYPQAHWLGYRRDQALVDAFAQADVLVFPSHTDTYGLVMLEANACGTPVAAFPVMGPIDIVVEGVNGCLHEDLGVAVARALTLSREACRAHAEANTWAGVAQRLLDNLQQIDWDEIDRRHAVGARPAH